MPINQWSDSIVIAELSDEPSFSEDLDALMRRLDAMDPPFPGIIVNLTNATYLNSSNIAQLLKLRKKLIDSDSRMCICGVSNRVWSVMLVTGLDKVFEFQSDVSIALASLQIE